MSRESESKEAVGAVREPLLCIGVWMKQIHETETLVFLLRGPRLTTTLAESFMRCKTSVSISLSFEVLRCGSPRHSTRLLNVSFSWVSSFLAISTSCRATTCALWLEDRELTTKLALRVNDIILAIHDEKSSVPLGKCQCAHR